MITDLFSHKIHSSEPEWQDKLVELAAIFNEFDRQVFDRVAIEDRLRAISPRVAVAAAEVARDESKFRDEISAYPAYLGLYRLEYSGSQWILRITETTRAFLLQEVPDVGAFMRLQLSLFQYPSGMGVAYSSEHARIQANARDRTLELVAQKIHVSPFRLLCQALLADAEYRGIDLFEASIAIPELYALVNHPAVNQKALVPRNTLVAALRKVRSGAVLPPERYESRFHILDHTEMIHREREYLSVRRPENEVDRYDLRKKIETIAAIPSEFDGFDRTNNSDDLMQVIESGSWGVYFDGVRTLSGETVSILAEDVALEMPEGMRTRLVSPIQPPPLKYALKQHIATSAGVSRSTRKEEFEDPEATRIKRERRSLMHKQMITALNDLLKEKGANPQENPHIDLYAEIPNDGAYLFEVKSGGENILAQIRKGVSQLYEYRFRYKNDIRGNAVLCLVLPNEPTGLPWVEEYLCTDRDIAICWLDNDGKVTSASLCEAMLADFLNAPSVGSTNSGYET